MSETVSDEVPPLPPHITFEQAKHFLHAMLQGDANRWHIIDQSAKDVWAGLSTR